MQIQICEFCGERWPRNRIKLTRRPNDEDVIVELCDTCIADIIEFVEAKK
jgi:hypothetical protein